MNNKVAIGLVAAVILIGIAFAYFNSAPSASAPLTATSTTQVATTTAVVPSAAAPKITPAASSTTVAPKTDAPVVKKTNRVVTLDAGSLITSTNRPTLTGTANVSGVAIVIDNPEGVGIAGSWEIPVTGGKWSYTPPQALKPGTYTVHLLGADAEVTSKLVISSH